MTDTGDGFLEEWVGFTHLLACGLMCLFVQQVMSPSHVPGTVVGFQTVQVNKTDKIVGA